MYAHLIGTKVVHGRLLLFEKDFIFNQIIWGVTMEPINYFMHSPPGQIPQQRHNTAIIRYAWQHYDYLVYKLKMRFL